MNRKYTLSAREVKFRVSVTSAMLD